ncbi:MAG: hypothetical protein K2N14_04310 [Clostridia bacterium]|nr:hypothetical protein [Clostridia bacterium]
MVSLKTVLVTFITLLAAVITSVAFTVLPDRLAFKGGDSYRFYVGDTSRNCREVLADPASAPLTRLTLQKVCGESTHFASLDAESFIEKMGAEIVFEEELSDSYNYYCTADLPYSVTLYGKTINLHVCVKESGVTVASPIIFGGY